ncbi:ECF RNA polymerase sigma factor SigW [Aquisphaera giovannonii]|uniref:ECF RNA polymerase sigma factor SigW n=1 Tax=Aquisphaera giovannonii TaxID=406548 RepID=A0A5B9W4S2_9BACT|nr:sigma-70 family RNA polymerase sigma factor [Aquisphaera giovannonii]QEH35010.1 ECF RNA polymerase sigma factor SigW [Aquisphaera giovannonii]
MDSKTVDDAAETERLLKEAAAGDPGALGILLERHRERLTRMVASRLDSRVRARIDASDVVQAAMIEAARRLADYERERPLPFYPWLHRLATDRLADLRRKLQAKKGDPRREQPIADLGDSAGLLVDRLVATDTTPGQAFAREERRRRVREALARLAPADREVLVMRHLEDFRIVEIAGILEISVSCAKMRYVRALERLRGALQADDSGTMP